MSTEKAHKDEYKVSKVLGKSKKISEQIEFLDLPKDLIDSKNLVKISNYTNKIKISTYRAGSISAHCARTKIKRKIVEQTGIEFFKSRKIKQRD
ncbi:MAG TPA: hypothetical protein PKJ33_01305 [Alphaproteobacteria bacterium]|nr:hypothetical protein [Alphaproteobacteria bacterium]